MSPLCGALGFLLVLCANVSKQEKPQQPWYIEIPIVIITTLIIVFLIHTFVGRIYLIPSQSMEPTLHGCAGCTGDRIAVEKVSYAFTDPEPGDVVVFKGTPAWNTNFVSNRSDNPVVRGLQNAGSLVGLVAPDENDLVKRIVAKEGQTIQCLPGDEGVKVDGELIDSSYTLNPPAYPVESSSVSDACGGPYFGPVTVPEDSFFMMGDNRTNSLDSRYHMSDALQGTIPKENIRGKVQAIILPVNRIGGVDNHPIQPQQLEAAK